MAASREHPSLLFDAEDRLLWDDGARVDWTLMSGRAARWLGPVPEGCRAVAFRQAFPLLGDVSWAKAGAALQWLRFEEQHRYCGACGVATEAASAGARRCASCGLSVWPRISPAVIVLVVRGGQVLLARHRAHRHGRWTALAGFVSPGETLEQCAVREVREECGIGIGGLRYVTSQPWPFPHSLMCGFLAEWTGGEPVADGHELAEVRWFDADSLPELPDPPALVHALLAAMRPTGA